MILFILTSIIWIIFGVAFPVQFSSGVTSTAATVAFGMLALLCVFYGVELRNFALHLDAQVLRHLPNLATRISTKFFPAPELTIFTMFLFGFGAGIFFLTVPRIGTAVGQAIGQMLVDHGVTNVGHLDIRESAEAIAITIMSSLVAAIFIPTLLLYGYTLPFRNQNLTLLKIFLSIGAAYMSLEIFSYSYDYFSPPSEVIDSKSDVHISDLMVFSLLVFASLITRLGEFFGAIALKNYEKQHSRYSFINKMPGSAG
jgi:hypothetical protein